MKSLVLCAALFAFGSAFASAAPVVEGTTTVASAPQNMAAPAAKMTFQSFSITRKIDEASPIFFESGAGSTATSKPH